MTKLELFREVFFAILLAAEPDGEITNHRKATLLMRADRDARKAVGK